VLVCCNTVKRAQEAWQGITQRLQGGSKVVLLHSRLIGRDRLEREQVVREACDVTSKQRKAVVLVATQVVEVSLNIDLDTIYTDPAPLEALIQRFGRINRRRQKDARSTPVHVFRQPDDGQHIYAPALVQATLRILNEQNGAEIDESQVNTWLDRIYQGEVAAEWKRLYTGAATDFQPIIDSLVAFNADESLEEQFYAAFDSVEVLPACFQAEYEQYMHEDRFLEAAQLFVSISNRQFAQLRRSRNIRPGPAPNDRINVALARYHSELGLILNE
jgi:CRISPR-associated endonuclease/helicase Cas3